MGGRIEEPICKQSAIKQRKIIKTIEKKFEIIYNKRCGNIQTLQNDRWRAKNEQYEQRLGNAAYC
jgi:hypothetical protein